MGEVLSLIEWLRDLVDHQAHCEVLDPASVADGTAAIRRHIEVIQEAFQGAEPPPGTEAVHQTMQECLDLFAAAARELSSWLEDRDPGHLKNALASGEDAWDLSSTVEYRIQQEMNDESEFMSG